MQSINSPGHSVLARSYSKELVTPVSKPILDFLVYIICTGHMRVSYPTYGEKHDHTIDK